MTSIATRRPQNPHKTSSAIHFLTARDSHLYNLTDNNLTHIKSMQRKGPDFVEWVAVDIK